MKSKPTKIIIENTVTVQKTSKTLKFISLLCWLTFFYGCFCFGTGDAALFERGVACTTGAVIVGIINRFLKWWCHG